MKKLKRFIQGDRTLVIDPNTGEKWFEDDTGPGLLQKAVNLTVATAKHVATGRKKASLEVINQRYEICFDCPSNKFAKQDPAKIPNKLKDVDFVGTCLLKSCGCNIHNTSMFPNKLFWESESCERGHWEDVK